MTARGVFVTGTDTGVGKTVVACALLRGLRARGLSAGAMKPIETGVGSAGPLDAIALREAAGSEDPLHAVCPHAFALAAAPSVAAAAEGRSIGLSDLLAAFERLATGRDFVVVEGAGGLLVPIDRAICMADLAAVLGLPLLIVARASLGTINHTRLTLAEAKRRGLAVAGVVLSHVAGPLDAAGAANLAHLREEIGDLLLGEIPPLEGGTLPQADTLQLERLLASL